MIIYTIQHKDILDDIDKKGFYTPKLSHCMDYQDNDIYIWRLCYRWMINRLIDKCGYPEWLDKTTFEKYLSEDDKIFTSKWEEIINEYGYPQLTIKPSQLPHPIWGWQKMTGRKDGKPDMRSWITDTPEEVVRLKLDINPDRLVFSDFSYWHIPLNMGYFPSTANNKQWVKNDEAFDKKCLEIAGINYMDLFSSPKQLLTNDKDNPIGQLQTEFLNSWKNCLVEISELGDINNPINFLDIEWIDRETQCVFWQINKDDILSVEHFTTRKAGKI